MSRARWTSEDLAKATQKNKANSQGKVKGTTGTGQKLVKVEIEVDGQTEDHYIFEGSKLLDWWLERGAKLKP